MLQPQPAGVNIATYRTIVRVCKQALAWMKNNSGVRRANNVLDRNYLLPQHNINLNAVRVFKITDVLAHSDIPSRGHIGNGITYPGYERLVHRTIISLSAIPTTIRITFRNALLQDLPFIRQVAQVTERIRTGRCQDFAAYTAITVNNYLFLSGIHPDHKNRIRICVVSGGNSHWFCVICPNYMNLAGGNIREWIVVDPWNYNARLFTLGEYISGAEPYAEVNSLQNIHVRALFRPVNGMVYLNPPDATTLAIINQAKARLGINPGTVSTPFYQNSVGAIMALSYGLYGNERHDINDRSDLDSL